MKPIRNELCARCGNLFDPTLGKCPICGTEGEFVEISEQYVKHSRVGVGRNLALFLTGLAGFQIIGIFLQIVLLVAYLQGAGAPGQSDAEYLTSVPVQMLTNGLAYIVTVSILLLICIKVFPELLKSFANYKNALRGIGWGFALIGSSIVWSIIIQLINPNTTVNENQQTLVTMLKAYPLASIVIFAILGPLSEELTYRVGLFSLSSRFGKIAGYIICPLVFGFIHFGWSTIGTSEVINELLNIPSYIIAGLILCYVYDKHGLCTAFVAHALNNLISILLSLA